MIYPGRRRVPRTKRRLRRKGAALKGRVPRPLPLSSQKKVYSFRRTCELKPFYYFEGAWSKSSTNQISNNSALTLDKGIFKFKLEDLPGYTDFLNLYENFKITGVKITFMPTVGTESTAPSSTATAMSPLAMCIDRGANDNIAANPTFISLLENQDVKLRNSNRVFSVYIAYPKAHAPADGVSQTVLMNPWLDSEVNGQVVDHHGLKFCFQETVTAERAIYFRVYATYYVKCRAPQ